MDDAVKVGQVWQSKNSGRRLEVVSRPNGDHAWMVRNAGGEDAEPRPIPEWILTDDYVLAKDAP